MPFRVICSNLLRFDDCSLQRIFCRNTLTPVLKGLSVIYQIKGSAGGLHNTQCPLIMRLPSFEIGIHHYLNVIDFWNVGKFDTTVIYRLRNFAKYVRYYRWRKLNIFLELLPSGKSEIRWRGNCNLEEITFWNRWKRRLRVVDDIRRGTQGQATPAVTISRAMEFHHRRIVSRSSLPHTYG